MPSYVGGRKPRTLTDEQIVRLYVEDKLDSDSIAHRAGCSGYMVLQIVRDAGHQIRPRGSQRAPRALTDEQIIAAYRAGQTGAEVAASAGCTASTVFKILRENGIDRRPTLNPLASRQATQQRRTRERRDG